MPTKTDRAIRLFLACAIDQQAHRGDNHQFKRHERKIMMCIDIVRGE